MLKLNIDCQLCGRGSKREYYAGEALQWALTLPYESNDFAKVVNGKGNTAEALGRRPPQPVRRDHLSLCDRVSRLLKATAGT